MCSTDKADSSPDQTNQTDRRNNRAYSREFLPAMIGYGLAVPFSTGIYNLADGAWWRYLVLLVPVIPALFVVRAIARHLGRIDEYQRQLQLESIAIGFGAAMIAALTIGFLSVGGVPTARWGAWVIFSVGMLGWLVAAVRRPTSGC